MENKDYSKTAGYVYVLSNPSMPDVVKIGRSKYGGKARADNLYKKGGTGVPMPFFMEFEIWSEDCVSLEVNVHNELHLCRANHSREFFEVSVDDAVKAVLSVFACDYDLTVQCSDSCIDSISLLAMEHYNEDVKRDIDLNAHDTPSDMVLSKAITLFADQSHLLDMLSKYWSWRKDRKSLIKGTL